MFEDDMDMFFDMPGGDDLEDVTDLFDVAASGELKNYSLAVPPLTVLQRDDPGPGYLHRRIYPARKYECIRSTRVISPQ